MSAFFAGVSIRQNGTRVTAAWANALRTAGASLEAALTALVGGGGSLTEQSLAIPDNQSVTDLTGMLASSTYRCTRIRYTIKRIATATVMEHGELVILYNGTTFAMFQAWFVGDPAGVTFTINSATGQVRYTSDDMAGTYDSVNSKIFWNVVTQG